MTHPGSLRSRRRKNRGMGDDGEVRSYVLSVRLSPAERVRVMAARGAWGISASEIGRRRVLGEPLPRPRPVSAPLPQVNVDTYRELGAREQFAQGFRFIAGESSPAALCHTLVDAAVPLESRSRCVAAIYVLFRDLFGTACAGPSKQHSEPLHEATSTSARRAQACLFAAGNKISAGPTAHSGLCPLCGE